MSHCRRLYDRFYYHPLSFFHCISLSLEYEVVSGCVLHSFTFHIIYSVLCFSSKERLLPFVLALDCHVRYLPVCLRPPAKHSCSYSWRVCVAPVDDELNSRVCFGNAALAQVWRVSDGSLRRQVKETN